MIDFPDSPSVGQQYTAADTTWEWDGDKWFIVRIPLNSIMVPQTDVGTADGVCPLDSNTKVDVSYLPDAVIGGMNYQGTWNADTNTPTLNSPNDPEDKGHYYVVNVAGATNLDGITDWQIGDWVVSNGTIWEKLDNTDVVTSVNTQTGAVSLGLLDLDDVNDSDYSGKINYVPTVVGPSGSETVSLQPVPAGVPAWTALTVADDALVLTAGERYTLDYSGGNFTPLLPASPVYGDEIEIWHIDGDVEASNQNIGRNGNNVEGAANDVLLDINYQKRTLIWTGKVGIGWRIAP